MKQLKVHDIMERNLKQVDYKDKVFHVAWYMYRRHIGSVFVRKDRNIVGILTERDVVHNCILGKKNIFNTFTKDIMSKSIISISPNSSVVDACNLMKKKKIKKLLVKDSRIRGIITLTDVVKNIRKLSKSKMFVGEMMSKQITMSPDKKVITIAKIMEKKNIGCVVILDGSSPKGIVTERDIVKNCAIGEKNFKKLLASDIMSYPLIVVKDSDSVLAAAKVMKKKKIKKLLVKGDGKLTGILTQTDIVYGIGKLV